MNQHEQHQKLVKMKASVELTMLMAPTNVAMILKISNYNLGNMRLAFLFPFECLCQSYWIVDQGRNNTRITWET
jgi:hypothetical protein